MTLNQYNILIDNFAEIYVDYKLGYISGKEIIELSKKGMIKKSDELRNYFLEDAYLKSENQFIEQIISFCNEDNNPCDEKDDVFDIPDEYFRIWELDSLLTIHQMNISEEEKLDKVYEAFYSLNFPNRWALNKIIRYSIKTENILYSDAELIKNLENYIEKELCFFLGRK
ncbi:hypothetical protein CGC58_07090 [Capnocytophaga stomatis]|uniref:Uncharacterized protein n=1 Tax=Capnocytophaga stomatis TaxID=1848904 RepID=A0A250FWY1_9FLAO|nr:hypothetical protein [Capnocytophaga stomatis]ATA89511.1 hypothetical protein CGC58_07090 [Capnocytophaga stomatis]